jgi:hypothetical protein
MAIREYISNTNGQYQVDQNTSLYNFKMLWNQFLTDLTHSSPYNLLVNPNMNKMIGHSFTGDTEQRYYPWNFNGTSSYAYNEDVNSANHHMWITLEPGASISQYIDTDINKIDHDCTYTVVLVADVVSGSSLTDNYLAFGLTRNSGLSFRDDRISSTTPEGDIFTSSISTNIYEIAPELLNTNQNIDVSKHIIRVKTDTQTNKNDGTIKFIISNPGTASVTFKVYSTAVYRGSIELGRLQSDYLLKTCTKYDLFDYNGTAWDGNQWQFTNNGSNWDAFAGKDWVYQEIFNALEGFTVKSPVRVVYNNAAALSLSGIPASASTDNVLLSVDDRILYNRIITGDAASANGIYLVKAGAWVRADDFDDAASIINGSYIFVQQGQEYQGSSWVLTSKYFFGSTPWTTGSPINFELFSALGQVIPGKGIIKNMSTGILDVDITETGGLSFNRNDVTAQLRLTPNEGGGNVYGETYSSVHIDNNGIVQYGFPRATSSMLLYNNPASGEATIDDNSSASEQVLWTSQKVYNYTNDLITYVMTGDTAHTLFYQTIVGAAVTAGTIINLRDHVTNGPYSDTMNPSTYLFYNPVSAQGRYLEVFRNGQRLKFGYDYTEINSSGDYCCQIQLMNFDWLVNDEITYRISDKGPVGQPGPRGIQGPQGPQGITYPVSVGVDSSGSAGDGVEGQLANVASELLMRDDNGWIREEALYWNYGSPGSRFSKMYWEPDTGSLTTNWGYNYTDQLTYIHSHPTSGDLTIFYVDRYGIHCGDTGTGSIQEPVKFIGNLLGTVTAPSTINLKENVVSINNPIDILNQINGVSFDWKSTGIKDYGVIAEEVEKVLPELVGKNIDGEIEGVKYSSFIGILIEAVKEQQKQINELKKQINLIQG